MQRPTPVIFAKNKSKSKSQRRSRRRKKQNKQPQHQGREMLSTSSSIPSRASAPSAGSRLWLQTYENIVRWQAEHQASYWKNLAQKLKNENDELRDKLGKYEQKNDEGSESSTSDDVEEEQDEVEEFTVDNEYLDFMEVTRKHQESMKLLRAESEAGDPESKPNDP